MIPGMDKGVLGMKVGETKTIKCTPTEAYGEKSDDAMIRESRERVEGALGKEETKVGSKVMIGQSGFPSTIVEVTDTEVRALLLSLLLSHPSESESEKLKARAGE
jgi:FKBP-type peptidyl-prolyl cis-trans isomerase 2